MNQIDLNAFTDLNPEKLLLLARAAESSERYDDMCAFMRELVKQKAPNAKGSPGLTVEERNLLSVAYKNVIGSRRASWRVLNAGESKDDQLHKDYRTQVEVELDKICSEVMDLLKQELIPGADSNADPESQVFYYKMAGDYYRYFAEFQPSGDHANNAQTNYQKALDIATADNGLAPTHPIRLGLALNYSVCHYEILKDSNAACDLAKRAFDEAIAKLDSLDEASYKDSTLIMQLLRDNLTLWTQDNQPQEDVEVEDVEGDQ
jgi:14-3-3 protein epsilon